jgi:serine/threonine protein kinase
MHIPKELPRPGLTLNRRYTIIEEIGHGGMGYIYKAFDSRMRREVALKVLMPQFVGHEYSVRRFFIEARAAKYLEHPNIVDLYDFGCSIEGYLFIAMEFLTGETVADIIVRDTKLPVKRSLKILFGITEALCHAHRKGVIHRDMKPENIMLLPWDGEGDFIKVLDFGIAAVLDRSMENSLNFGEIIGTPCYMSPEQIRGTAVDGRCDIYALGILLYEMFTGNPPFLGETPYETMKMHLSDEVPEVPVLDLSYDTRNKLCSLLDDMLEKDPDKRLESADALKLRLRELLDIIGQDETDRKENLSCYKFVPFHERCTLQGQQDMFILNSQPTISAFSISSDLNRDKTLLQSPQSDMQAKAGYRVCPQCQKINSLENLCCDRCKFHLGIDIAPGHEAENGEKLHLKIVKDISDEFEEEIECDGPKGRQNRITPWTVEVDEISYLKMLPQDFIALSLLHLRLEFGNGEENDHVNSLKKIFIPEIEAWSNLVIAKGGIILFDTGEEIRCLFGLQGKNGGSTRESMICALDMKKRVQNFRNIFKESLNIKMGIATSNVPKIKVLEGSPEGFIRGSGVDLATRLAYIAPMDTIIADEESARLTLKLFHYNKFNTIRVRGSDKPINIYATG